jgi:hypothetical protein
LYAQQEADPHDHVNLVLVVLVAVAFTPVTLHKPAVGAVVRVLPCAEPQSSEGTIKLLDPDHVLVVYTHTVFTFSRFTACTLQE